MNKEYDVKIGDKLYNCENGWGEVVDVKTYEGNYPIILEFKDGYKEGYTNDFKCYSDDDMQSLFWDVPTIPLKPLPKIEVDTLVEVWVGSSNKMLRYFSHFNEEGFMCCFRGGRTSRTAVDKDDYTRWENYRIIEEEK